MYHHVNNGDKIIKMYNLCLIKIIIFWTIVRGIAYGFGGPSEKNVSPH